jgi:hypothetical protein
MEEEKTAVIARVRNIINAVSNLSLPIRLTIGGLIGVLGGSSFLGFISEFAGYSYAIHYGARPPLEGIPYLRASVTLLSLTLFLAGAAAFTTVYFIGKIFFMPIDVTLRSLAWVKKASPDQVRRAAIRIRTMPILEKMKRVAMASIFLTGAILSMAFISGLTIEPGSKITFTLVDAVLIYALSFVLYMLMLSPQVWRWLALLSATFLFVIAPIALFNAHFYSRLLRFIGYGGGIHVSLVFSEPEAEVMRRTEGALFLRTSSAIILYDFRQGKFHEIPMQTIRSISHPAVSFSRREFILPH